MCATKPQNGAPQIGFLLVVFAGEEAFSGAGEDAGAGEVVWLAVGMSGRARDAGLSTFELALELEACSGS
jgi:hypothetical protein